MSVECIHGFDEGLCDSCFPRKTAEPTGPVPRRPARVPGSGPAPSRPLAPPRAASVRTPAKKAAPRAAAAAPAPEPIDVAAQRIYHVTHIRNLEAIVASGAILADSALTDDRPTVDVGSEAIRVLRRGTELPDGTKAADHVPFFLSPHAALWNELRTGADDARWSGEARSSSPTDFVLLVASLADAPVLANGDSSASGTSFASTPEGVERLLRLLVDGESGLEDAEALVPTSFPLSSVVLVGVANNTVRSTVKKLVDGSGASPRTAVYPPWFQPTPED